MGGHRFLRDLYEAQADTGGRRDGPGDSPLGCGPRRVEPTDKPRAARVRQVHRARSLRQEGARHRQQREQRDPPHLQLAVQPPGAGGALSDPGPRIEVLHADSAPPPPQMLLRQGTKLWICTRRTFGQPSTRSTTGCISARAPLRLLRSTPARGSQSARNQLRRPPHPSSPLPQRHQQRRLQVRVRARPGALRGRLRRALLLPRPLREDPLGAALHRGGPVHGGGHPPVRDARPLRRSVRRVLQDEPQEHPGVPQPIQLREGDLPDARCAAEGVTSSASSPAPPANRRLISIFISCRGEAVGEHAAHQGAGSARRTRSPPSVAVLVRRAADASSPHRPPFCSSTTSRPTRSSTRTRWCRWGPG